MRFPAILLLPRIKGKNSATDLDTSEQKTNKNTHQNAGSQLVVFKFSIFFGATALLPDSPKLHFPLFWIIVHCDLRKI